MTKILSPPAHASVGVSTATGCASGLKRVLFQESGQALQEEETVPQLPVWPPHPCNGFSNKVKRVTDEYLWETRFPS